MHLSLLLLISHIAGLGSAFTAECYASTDIKFNVDGKGTPLVEDCEALIGYIKSDIDGDTLEVAGQKDVFAAKNTCAVTNRASAGYRPYVTKDAVITLLQRTIDHAKEKNAKNIAAEGTMGCLNQQWLISGEGVGKVKFWIHKAAEEDD